MRAVRWIIGVVLAALLMAAAVETTPWGGYVYVPLHPFWVPAAVDSLYPSWLTRRVPVPPESARSNAVFPGSVAPWPAAGPLYAGSAEYVVPMSASAVRSWYEARMPTAGFKDRAAQGQAGFALDGGPLTVSLTFAPSSASPRAVTVSWEPLGPRATLVNLWTTALLLPHRTGASYVPQNVVRVDATLGNHRGTPIARAVVTNARWIRHFVRAVNGLQAAPTLAGPRTCPQVGPVHLRLVRRSGPVVRVGVQCVWAQVNSQPLLSLSATVTNMAYNLFPSTRISQLNNAPAPPPPPGAQVGHTKSTDAHS